jgi:hypothetical protein
MAIDVSLCGPGSLLTSMFAPTLTLLVFPGAGSGWNPGADTVSNFCHQVGRLYAEAPGPVPAEAGNDQPTVTAMLATAAAATKARSRAICLASRPLCLSRTGCSHSPGDNGNHAWHHLKLRAALAQVATMPVPLSRAIHPAGRDGHAHQVAGTPCPSQPASSLGATAVPRSRSGYAQAATSTSASPPHLDGAGGRPQPSQREPAVPATRLHPHRSALLCAATTTELRARERRIAADTCAPGLISASHWE